MIFCQKLWIYTPIALGEQESASSLKVPPLLAFYYYYYYYLQHSQGAKKEGLHEESKSDRD